MTVIDVRRSEPTAEFERTPPQDISAEQSVLGGMLLSKDAIADVVEVLRSTDFYRPAHQTVYDAIVDLYGRGEPADPVTVAAELTRHGVIAKVGGAPYLHTLVASVPTAANAGYYARIVAERAILRRLVEAGTRIVQFGYASDGGNVDDLVDRAQQAVYDVTERRTSEDFVRLEDVMQSALDEIEAIGSRGGDMVGVPTGFADLDELTNGLHPGQMVVVAGRPALGKSTVGLDFARACSIKHGLASVIFSLEMTRNEITMRLLSAEARVPLHHMRSGRMTDEDWARLARRMGEVAEAPLFIDDSPNLTMMEIRAKARRLKQRHDLRLVVVDYMQLMTSMRRVENRQQEVSELSRALKLLAKELAVPVVAISQLNRGPEQRTDKRPQLSDLRESGCMPASTTLLRADTGAPVTFATLLRDGWDGVLAWSVDESMTMVAAPVTNVFPSGVKEVFRLTLASGRTVEATANHPFLTPTGWTPLGEVTVGSRVAIPRRTPAPVAAGLDWSDERIGLLAHLIGGACVPPRQPVRYTSDDEANLRFVERAAIAEFGITPGRVTQGNREHVDLPAPYQLARGRRHPIEQWLGDLGAGSLRSDEKRIPDIMYSASEAQVATFLRHLLATGGTVVEPSASTNGIPTVAYRSTSRALVDGVAVLLSRLGIVACIREAVQSHRRPAWHLLIGDAPSLLAFCSHVGGHCASGARADRLPREVAGRVTNANTDLLPGEVWDVVKDECRRVGITERELQAVVGIRHCGASLDQGYPSRECFLKIADVLDSDALRRLCSTDVWWDRVAAIAAVGLQPVYDATVKGTHNFIADGIVAHNSIEQDADMVVLLHREDAYEKESPRAGEADLIVAKHRNGPTATITVAFQGHYSRFVDMSPV